MVDDDALTYKGFWCGDSGDSLENYSVKKNLLRDRAVSYIPEEDRHCSIAAPLPSALPMKTHWSTSARMSTNRGTVWLTEFVFGFGYENLYVCSRSGQAFLHQSISVIGFGNNGDSRWRCTSCDYYYRDHRCQIVVRKPPSVGIVGGVGRMSFGSSWVVWESKSDQRAR